MDNYNPSRRDFLKTGLGLIIASSIPPFIITGCGKKEYELKIIKAGSVEKVKPVKLKIAPIEVLINEYSTKLSAGTLNNTSLALGIIKGELYCIEIPIDLSQKLDDKLYLDANAVILGSLQHVPVRKRRSSNSNSGQVQINDNDVFNPVYLEDKVIEIKIGNDNIGFRSRKIPAVKVTNQDCSSSVVYTFFTIPGEKSTAGSLYAVENPVFDIDEKIKAIILNNKCKRIIVKGEGAEYKLLKMHINIPEK
ncbi:hypothetical protein HY498_01665 [Candidatus Woesearchaeota archaeon]|nr:hypothetical protein [Candidatus Woesearchaeota archaeon]